MECLNKKELEFLRLFARVPNAERDVTRAGIILGVSSRQPADWIIKTLECKGMLQRFRSELRKKCFFVLTDAAEKELAENFPTDVPAPLEAKHDAERADNGSN